MMSFEINTVEFLINILGCICLFLAIKNTSYVLGVLSIIMLNLRIKLDN